MHLSGVTAAVGHALPRVRRIRAATSIPSVATVSQDKDDGFNGGDLSEHELSQFGADVVHELGLTREARSPGHAMRVNGHDTESAVPLLRLVQARATASPGGEEQRAQGSPVAAQARAWARKASTAVVW